MVSAALDLSSVQMIIAAVSMYMRTSFVACTRELVSPHVREGLFCASAEGLHTCDILSSRQISRKKCTWFCILFENTHLHGIVMTLASFGSQIISDEISVHFLVVCWYLMIGSTSLCVTNRLNVLVM